MKARFERLGNDLFWRFYDVETDTHVKWSGYHDDYWWNVVSKSDQFQIRGDFRLDPITDEVTRLDD